MCRDSVIRASWWLVGGNARLARLPRIKTKTSARPEKPELLRAAAEPQHRLVVGVAAKGVEDGLVG